MQRTYEELVAVIPAAGRGVRALPDTARRPKPMLMVGGKSLLQRNIELLRDQLAVRRVVLVTGHCRQVIRDAFGDGTALGVQILYVDNESLELGLAHSVALGGRIARRMSRRTVVVLADELYVKSDHAQLRDVELADGMACCGYLSRRSPGEIRANYSLSLDGRRVRKLTEKPTVVSNDLLGTGTALLTPAVLSLLDAAWAARGSVDWIGFLGDLATQRDALSAVELGGNYVNVNHPDDLHRAAAMLETSAEVRPDRAGGTPARERYARAVRGADAAATAR